MSYALITGASKGIGRAIAFELAKRNYDLLLTARSVDLLKEVLQHKMLLFDNHVQINKVHIIHSMLLDQP